MRRVTLGLIQSISSPEPTENLETAIQNIRSAARSGARIICLQELFKSRYFCQSIEKDFFSLAEPIPGATTKALSEIANELSVTLIVPIFEKRGAGIFHNSAAILGPDGSLLSVYRKMHIPDDPGYHEKYYFSPGDQGVCVVQTPYARIGVLICWDQWFPEAARLAALQGAEVLFYPTAIGWGRETGASSSETELEAWQLVQRSHAITNGCYVASVNRVGQEGDIRFWGHSFICDPFGAVQAQAGEESAILISDCDLDRIQAIRCEWPFLRDRRIDAYAKLSQRYDDDILKAEPL